ncbi:MAG: RNA polymerase sigma factor [Caulobacteraceae bacterium]|nr:RNA polymerase sigma factor [Caulobacteraceae bacterium]
MSNPKARPPVLASSHDVELAGLAQGGDRAAYGELVRRHGAAIRGLLLRLGADPTLADDVAQEGFLTAFEQIGDFRGESAFLAWIKRIVARLYIKRLRRETRGGLLDLTARPDGETSAIAQDVLGGADLDQALRGLTRSERLCVGLCYGAGFSHAEVADALNAPLSAVKSEVKRGLDKLRSGLAWGGV